MNAPLESGGWRCGCGHDSLDHDRVVVQTAMGKMVAQHYPCRTPGCDCAEVHPPGDTRVS